MIRPTPFPRLGGLHVTDETDDGSPSWRATIYPPSPSGHGLKPHVYDGDITRLGAFHEAMKNYLGVAPLERRDFPPRDWKDIEAALANERAFGEPLTFVPVQGEATWP